MPVQIRTTCSARLCSGSACLLCLVPFLHCPSHAPPCARLRLRSACMSQDRRARVLLFSPLPVLHPRCVSPLSFPARGAARRRARRQLYHLQSRSTVCKTRPGSTPSARSSSVIPGRTSASRRTRSCRALGHGCISSCLTAGAFLRLP